MQPLVAGHSLFATLAVAACVLGVLGSTVESSGADEISFNRDVRPILSNRCFACHGPDEKKRKSGLRLDVREAALKKHAMVPGDASTSELIKRITSTDPDERMPPLESKKELTSAEIETFRQWIDEGAAYEKHWAFEPITRSELPGDSSGSWQNPIDAFVAARLKKANLTLSAEAPPSVLIRRLYVDLLGILPSIAEVNAFLADEGEDPYERLATKVLASPHYGERWGRHWLDQARYADSDGYAPDGDRTMWPYRDWVIQALNRDLGFDRFSIEQLAGDLLPEPTLEQLIATGFHRNTLINTEGGSDPEQFRNESMVDRTNTTGAVWMGLTVACAQCHAHKYDPITHSEYYQLFAFFNNSEDKNSRNPELVLRTPEDEAKLAKLRENLKAAKETNGKTEDGKLSPEVKIIEGMIKEVERRAPRAMIMGDRKKDRRPTHIHIRGNFLREGDSVAPGVPKALLPMPGAPEKRSRIDLARWLVDPQHPLTARVTVNRIWMHHFGRGLVETENDFGLQGTLPTHPALLDWLAAEFIESGWSMKELHRLMVTAATFRQSSEARPDLVAIDPLNKLLGRQNRPRVEAEVVRDLALSASGLLTRKIGGPSVYPPQPEGIYAFTQNKKNWKESQGADRYRRGIYTFFYRSAPHPMLTIFDTPNFQAVCTRREKSNTPLQALQVANDRMFIEFARGLARRVLATASGMDPASRISHAFRLCFSREPTAKERETLARYAERQLAAYKANEEDAAKLAGANDWPDGVDIPQAATWIALARVLLNLDEFVTRD
jgi:hypothetical protein